MQTWEAKNLRTHSTLNLGSTFPLMSYLWYLGYVSKILIQFSEDDDKCLQTIEFENLPVLYTLKHVTFPKYITFLETLLKGFNIAHLI